MAYTLADLDVIKKALATGTKKVKLNGREVDYHSVTDMIKAKNIIEAELMDLGLLDYKKRRPRAFSVNTGKGL